MINSESAVGANGLASVAYTPSTSLSTPGTTDFANHSDPPSFPQYPVDTNIQYGGQYGKHWMRPSNPCEEQHFFPDAVLAQAGAQAYPSQPELTTTINNGTFIGGNLNNNVRNSESGINILHRNCAPEAFHDPADSYDQPRCHPETRIKMQDKLWKWCNGAEWPSRINSTDTEPTILWVHGPAGAGKSAIMETLSQKLEKEGRMGGAFFFKRGHPSRGNARVLFATIALQLAVNSSQVKARISQTVEENPTLLGRSVGAQLRELILKPSAGLDSKSPPRIIIIDGLDECDGHNVQQEILRLIRESTQQRTPLRFIIASRPEAHIHEVFADPSFSGWYRGFNVESSFGDVHTYLVAEFSRIHREHSTMAAVPTPWPSEEVTERLVEKSSGYFIYASTIIKFVDDKNFRPTQRLEAVKNISGKPGFKSPFSALDELYTQILSAVPQNPHLVPILSVIDNFSLSCPQIDELLGLEPGDTALSLRGLHSVVEFEDRGIKRNMPRFIHASFSDFLCDPFRAGDFYIRDAATLAELVRLAFTELGYRYEDPIKNRNALLARS
ncbi:hypothetical protein C8J57DRAFT_288190 [Mycena rebaudengoi]|nr:hypothetical protein C8J57DRAFT_288190 [Mycena rebaudengoi]